MRDDRYYRTSVALTESDTVVATTPCRGVLISCSAAGNIKLGFADGSTVTIDVAVGTVVLPLCIAQFWSTGTTATASVYQLM